MPRYAAEQIYAFARKAGFSPDQSATMTAIALAESDGNSRAHNPYGEDSRGLWQINARAHPDLAAKFDLYDPVQNARAAYEISGGGTNISPWTTTHGGLSARYLRYREEAEAAAAAYGDGRGLGMWSGTSGYGDHVAAGESSGRANPSTTGSGPTDGSEAVVVAHGTTQPPASGLSPGEEYGIPLDEPDARRGAEYGIPLDRVGGEQAPTGTGSAAGGGATTTLPEGGDRLHKFIDAAVAQTGDRYIFGVEVSLDDPNPTAFDCSELVQWAAHQAGVDVPDGAWNQYQRMRDSGTVIPVEKAVHTPGALLFTFSSDPSRSQPTNSHVAISLGNGKTIEAYGTNYGVGSFEASLQRFQYAAVIPGISDHVAAPGDHEPAVPADHHLLDGFDHRLPLDPDPMDTHAGALTASLTLTGIASDPHQVDEPVPPEPDHTGDEVETADVDADGYDDALEEAVHWSAQPPDDISAEHGAHGGHDALPAL